ncbi:2'-5' RNA ligase family protein [Lacibacter luteus]|uniref:2'-5' RNA ligase family protein n=1 Tax=Lacibacter luteus TaxID=2508719 RepID=A0A4Q1CMD7_9BACT|nr:2'-5' RNA ligase family protein [Lacibacter luteus]RXK62183.1 2'-5' RNA ligase family protein [Lacibacter luteus]
MNNAATHSMFYIAVLCPPEIDNKIQAHKVWMRERFACTVAMKSPAHITLIPPFWLANEREQILINTLHSLNTSVQSFTIQLKNFSHFSNKVIFAAVEENHVLGSLRKATEDHFITVFHDSIKPDDRPFHPHVTIANRDIKPGDFNKAWAHFEKLDYEQSFPASKISLLKLSPAKWNVIAEQTF